MFFEMNECFCDFALVILVANLAKDTDLDLVFFFLINCKWFSWGYIFHLIVTIVGVTALNQAGVNIDLITNDLSTIFNKN